MTAPIDTARPSTAPWLPRSERMPVLFVGHGSPLNVLEDNAFRRGWQALGAQFGHTFPKPALILCISAHWLTDGWWLTGQAHPPTLHDFGAFGPELFAQQYPAPGAPAAAEEISQVLGPSVVGIDTQTWGLDHGAWSILKPMFPAADIPVIQLSINWARPPEDHLALGQRLAFLRERGVLIVGSGNIVHNLRAMRRDAPADQAHDWAIAFDEQVAQWLRQGDRQSLVQIEQMGPLAKLAHPSHDHYLPLLYALGASDRQDALDFFNLGIQGASISMRSVIWR